MAPFASGRHLRQHLEVQHFFWVLTLSGLNRLFLTFVNGSILPKCADAGLVWVFVSPYKGFC